MLAAFCRSIRCSTAKFSFVPPYHAPSGVVSQLYYCPSKGEGVKKSPPILGGVEARKSFGGGKGRP